MKQFEATDGPRQDSNPGGTVRSNQEPSYFEDAAARLSVHVSRELNAAANRGGTEADFRREAAQILEQAGIEAGLTIVPRDEFSVARGRVDSLYNRLVLEYKRPGVLSGSNGTKANRNVIQQVKEYILDVASKEKREVSRLAGVATDGLFFVFVRRVGEGWAVDDPIQVNAPSTERFLRLLFALATGAALVPENLVNDFGPKHMRTQQAVRAIYRAFVSSKEPLVQKLFEQWRKFFSEATDYKEWSESIESKPEFRSFVKSLWTAEEIRHLDAASVFFVLHTYYALLIKLIATMAAARFAGGKVAALSNIAVKEGEDLRQAFADLERGGLFREYGIRNFLEGDFFGWYLAAWNQDIEDSVKTLTKRLAEYDPGTLELAPENARDLLKKLYHYLLPREIRHDLGEYYTPDWLAERLCIQTLSTDLGDPRKRVLDPGCGSGTFIVILIKYIKEWTAKRNWDPSRTLELILQNIIGFDLNPLAVIAARTNYLLALGDLLKARKGDIDIPVYQCDSILTPSQGSGLFDGEVYPLKTSVGEFRIPSIFANRERMDALANTLDESVEADVRPDAFVEQLNLLAKLEPEEKKATESELTGLYSQLVELHKKGLNGVWARIIKNSFAPLFIEQSDYIVGNPPWVNWENLPDDYRRLSSPLWIHYGLFPKRDSGMDTILGAAKYDISMLMTLVAGDKYLKASGKLGFILSRSLFKTVAAGQGFRRFSLPGGTPFGPIVVEDMVELKPFEGATNKTVVAKFVKGYAIRYPISYPYWKKVNARTSIGFDTPYEDVTSKRATFFAWKARPIKKDDPTSAWLTGRQKALEAIQKILGRSDFQARAGTFTGGANGVYWLDVTGARPGGQLMVSNFTEGARRKVAGTQAAVEKELVYPLLRGAEVSRWRASGELSILLTHERGERLKAISETTMAREFPKSFAYLKRFEKELRKRAAFRRYFKEDSPFYSIFNIGDYTFSTWKVVWREQASIMTAAVVGSKDRKPVIPDHKLMVVEVESSEHAHYLCAVLNSSEVRVAVAGYAENIQMDTHILENICIPAFDRQDRTHIKLSQLSKDAHLAAESGSLDRLEKIENDIDAQVAKLWNLTQEELKQIKQSAEEM
jgi:methylase of polypeptide subunit release factors